MARISRLSSIAGLAVGGTALGLYLGSSAISEINPAYYSTPLSGSTFHADLVPSTPEQGLYQRLPELAPAVADSTVRPIVPHSFAEARDTVFDSDIAAPSSYRAPAAELVLAEADRFVSRGLGADELRDIERYAHFPVSEDEVEPRRLTLRSHAETDEGGCDASESCEQAPGI